MNTKVFQYRNILPPDVSEAGRFLLCVMAFLNFPIGEGAARRILKCVVCDDNAPGTLKQLISGGYLIRRETGQGVFLAITAKTLSYLDIHAEYTPHRTVKIPDASLLTNRLKGELAAREIVSLAASVYIEAWDKLPEDEQQRYLAQKGTDQHRFEQALLSRSTTTIDILPRSLVSAKEIVKAVVDGLEAGRIPFTAYHRQAVYRSADLPMLHAMENLDGALRYKMTTAAMRKKPDENCGSIKAKRYLELTDELAAIDQTITALKPKATVLTYAHGEKALTLSNLDANGIYIRTIADGQIYFGILNNAPYGLPGDTLSRRIDMCVSLADHLSLTPFISIYTLPEAREVTRRRLPYTLERLALPNPPQIRLATLPDKKPVTKHKALSGLAL